MMIEVNAGNVYIVQFGTGTNINLLPLAAALLHSSLKQAPIVRAQMGLPDILFRVPDDPVSFAAGLQDVAVIGFSCFLWNTRISLQCARAVKERFPKAMVVMGGPSVPKELQAAELFLADHPSVDVLCPDEGESVFSALCRCGLQQKELKGIPGIIFRNLDDGQVQHTGRVEIESLADLASPYEDGTFDVFFKKFGHEFSGAILETNRGCPYECSFCNWGTLPTRRIREKPMLQVRNEIDWIGRHQINYVAMSDSNFGIRKRDLQVAQAFADTRKKYGAPNFISVSWVKNSSTAILRISEILKEAGIGFRVTLSLQSLNPKSLAATKRSNIKRKAFDELKQAYREKRLFSYTELMLGLPEETFESFLHGLNECLSDSLFDQLFVYPLLLFPNTEVSLPETRSKYGIVSQMIPNRYTKSRELVANLELVEIVVGTKAMPPDRWRETFVLCYFTLAIHDERLAFFIFRYLQKELGIRVIDLVLHARQIASDDLSTLQATFERLDTTAHGVQELGRSHLVEPRSFNNIPFDPPEGVFLECLMDKERFLADFAQVVISFLTSKGYQYDQDILDDLFLFQGAVMAHPNGPSVEQMVLEYNWFDYFAFTLRLQGQPLCRQPQTYRVVDPHPSHGDTSLFLQNHFDVRGRPAFNDVLDAAGNHVFPGMT